MTFSRVVFKKSFSNSSNAAGSVWRQHTLPPRSLPPHCFPKPERFPWLLWFWSPSAEASRWHRAACAFWNAAEESWARSTMSFWHLASVSIPDNLCRDQGPLNQLFEPESLCAAIGITLQKAGRGTCVTTGCLLAAFHRPFIRLEGGCWVNKDVL